MTKASATVVMVLLAIAGVAGATDRAELDSATIDPFFGGGKIDVASGREETPAAAPAVVRTYTTARLAPPRPTATCSRSRR